MIQERNIKTAIWISIAALVVLLFGSSLTYADSEELEQIRHAIKVKKAKWHANKTSVSELSMKEKRNRLGGDEFEDLMAESLSSQETAPIPVLEGAPATFDWRNLEGISYVTPVKNQGSCGSCWAFATTAGLESQVMMATGGMPIDLSEQILVSCSGVGSCSGGSSAAASSFIRDTGLPLESCLQYTATNNLCSNACLNWENDTQSINEWHPASANINDIRNAVYSYGPVIATMYVYNDFYSYRSGVYSYATGSYVGAHAVLVVGYDDIQQAFIVKNSWGSGWGEAGYFMISYDEVGGTSRFGYSTMVYDGYGDNPTPDPEPEPDPEPDPDPDPEPCSYSLSSSGATFKPAGGTGSFSLYAQGSCSLESASATSSAAWVIITSTVYTSSGVAVEYGVDENTGTERYATINIAGLSYNIKQLKAKSNNGKPNKDKNK
jgi:C1A family cysteine protease